MKPYTRVRLAEREEISCELAAGSRLRVMDRQLGRAPSTIGRELRRGGADTKHLSSHARTARRETLGSAAAKAPDIPEPPLRKNRVSHPPNPGAPRHAFPHASFSHRSGPNVPQRVLLQF